METNLCNNEKKIDERSCVLIGSMLVTIKGTLRSYQGSPRLYKGVEYLPFMFYTTSSLPNHEISRYGNSNSVRIRFDSAKETQRKGIITCTYGVSLGCLNIHWNDNSITFQRIWSHSQTFCVKDVVVEIIVEFIFSSLHSFQNPFQIKV